MNRFYRMAWPPLRLFSSLVWGLRSYGAANVPPRGGVLLAANHQSYLDPLMIGLAVRRPLHYVARRSLFRFPPFALLIRALNAHPIEREGSDLAGVRVVLRCLHEGQAVLIFPEGTRTRTGRLGPVKQGVSRIALRAGVPILPVLVDGTRHVWPPQNRLPKSGEINIIFGSPVAPREGFPGPGDLRNLWIELSRQSHRRIARGFLNDES
jgi:1-acyl-sn-glycerol-3-phosphate acyltransferase